MCLKFTSQFHAQNCKPSSSLTSLWSTNSTNNTDTKTKNGGFPLKRLLAVSWYQNFFILPLSSWCPYPIIGATTRMSFLKSNFMILIATYLLIIFILKNTLNPSLLLPVFLIYPSVILHHLQMLLHVDIHFPGDLVVSQHNWTPRVIRFQLHLIPAFTILL